MGMASMVKKIIINGKFLSQKITGVQRYAREVLNRLDPLVSNLNIEIVMAEDAKDIPDFKNIAKKVLSGKASVFWEQIKLPLYIKKQNAIGLHLCHIAPILKPDIVCIHDANVARNPQWFTKKLVLWYGLIHWSCALWAKKILTVSNFSKKEIQDIFKISDSRIENIGSGWQHIERISLCDDTLERFNLKEKSFYFSLGTQAPHKNMRWVYQCAKNNPNELFLLSGSTYHKVFKKTTEELPNNVRYLGYLSDADVKTLMKNCKAFIFPSLYEGFGLPPLEALSMGTTIFASDIPIMREIFEDSVNYIDIQSQNYSLQSGFPNGSDKKASILGKYNWQFVAEKILKTLHMISEG